MDTAQPGLDVVGAAQRQALGEAQGHAWDMGHALGQEHMSHQSQAARRPPLPRLIGFGSCMTLP